MVAEDARVDEAPERETAAEDGAEERGGCEHCVCVVVVVVGGAGRGEVAVSFFETPGGAALLSWFLSRSS